ncbi:hypothetical protein [Brucella gallinifaecis]|uniref:hypothetical protein n=1 Tax=Brucella gallinifaecis TaxID=215590 RepID=UPI002363079F|nr:hypothetical protein [Brucella gallinifaecis]
MTKVNLNMDDIELEFFGRLKYLTNAVGQNILIGLPYTTCPEEAISLMNDCVFGQEYLNDHGLTEDSVNVALAVIFNATPATKRTDFWYQMAKKMQSDFNTGEFRTPGAMKELTPELRKLVDIFKNTRELAFAYAS